MKNILYISNYKKGIGGISVQLDILKNKIDSEGYNTHIFSFKHNVFIKFILCFKLLFKGKKFDIFHIHGCSYLGFLPIFIGIISGKILKKKIIVTYHGGGASEYFKKYPRLIKYILSKSDCNIVLSGYLKEIFAEYELSSVIIPNIIEKNQRIKIRSKINPSLISVRSLELVYNIQCILKAFKLLKEDIASATLTIIGNGSEKKNLKQYAEENKIKDVFFVNRVSNDLISTYLNKNDIFISSPHTDNQPVSILEAFNSGLLVISSNVGGIPYMIKNGYNGLLFEDNNHLDLAQKIKEAIYNQEKSLAMISEADKILSNYTWDNVRTKYIDLYK